MELTVSEKREVLNLNQVSFEEREEQLRQMKKAEEREGQKRRGSPYNSFLQINKDTYKLEDKLMTESPLAYRIWRFLANNMDEYNAVIVSQQVLEEVFEVSKTTIWRAMKVLTEGEYLKVYRTGGSNIYAINDKMVWNSWGTNYKYSKFSANVIISSSEQVKEIQREIKTIKHKEVKLK